MLNESISAFVSQGLNELTATQVSFGFKLLALFGFIYLFNSVIKSGGSIINMAIYVIAFFKWLIFKIMKKDV